MRRLNFSKESNEKLCLGLGFFDCVHLGHRSLVKRVTELAGLHGWIPSVFTFTGNPYLPFQPERKLVMTLPERLAAFQSIGVQTVICADFTEKFRLLSAREFLDELTSRYDLGAAVFGPDYRFGRGAEGNVGFLRAYLKEKNILCLQEDFLRENGIKVSTSDIVRLLELGEIQDANRRLGTAFSIAGQVVSGYRVGRTLGFPTANIEYPAEKVKLALGVYLTETAVEHGGIYPSVTNVGCRPTFGDEKIKAESFLDGFSGDLYGKNITVRFHRFLRKTKRFDSVEELAVQLERDKQALKEENHDTIWSER